MSAVTTERFYAAQGYSDHPSKHAAMEGVRSPAQVFALVIGATLTVAGVVGFFYNADFGTGDGTARDAVLGILDVNGWHNVVHIVSGALGLLVASSYSGSRVYELGLGAVQGPGVAPADEHASAGGDERPSDLEPEALTASGDDRRASRERGRHAARLPTLT